MRITDGMIWKGMYALLMWGVMLTGGCRSDDQVDLLALDIDHYRPVDEFVEAYEAISQQKNLRAGKDYDLEKTVRIINALELAQVRADSFDEFLDVMARQDYSGVAPDVLEAKRKLFPVLEYTYKLRQQDEQLNDVWLLLRGAARGGETLVTQTSSFTLFRAAQGDIFALLGILNSGDAERSTNEAFAQYEKDKELKFRIREDLQQLRQAYRQYLEDYAPIYRKYMQAYDALCIEKDKAYMDLYAGRTEEALKHTERILRQYPQQAEAMLLQAMALTIIGGTEQSTVDSQVLNSHQEVLLPDSMNHQPDKPVNAFYGRAEALLGQYQALYPDRTAPALVIEGLLQQQLGHEEAAMGCFHQASVEYPRQASQLTDMLDAYNMRTYLSKTPEGQYLRRLYASVMEGYGLFSPNLLKARYYADQGKMTQSREEIYNHFFRRGNQGLYDELLSDMQFCEEHLYGAFKGLLLESSYIDVSIEPQRQWLFWHSDDVMRVRINNRSDVDLENVRIFLCIHYTGMYKDEYDVVRVPKAANIIARHSTADLDTVVLRYPGKTYDDITRIRAIAMTDDRICWVDDVDYKQAHALGVLRSAGREDEEQQVKVREEYLRHYSLRPQQLQHTLKEGITVLPPEDDPAVEKGWWRSFLGWLDSGDNDLRIELPRVLAMTDPVFSLNALDADGALTPVDNYLAGTSIHLRFDYEPTYEEHLMLYIYSETASFRVEILYRGARSEVIGVTII